MARKPRGAKVPIGEIEKIAVSLGKTLGGTAMKGLKALAGSASKPAKKAAPRKTPVKKVPAKKAPAVTTPAKKAPAKKAPAKKAPAVKAPAKKAPSSVRASKADKGVSPTGRPIGRVAATPPPRPRRDYYRKDAILPQDASSQRAAERQANRILRRADGPSAPTPRGNTQPVNVRGSIVTPPRKAYLQDRSKPSSSSYEADTFRGQQRADARSIGRGQPRRRKRK